MRSLILLVFLLVFVSACGENDDYFDEEVINTPVDTIIVVPTNPNDTTKATPSDSIIVTPSDTTKTSDNTVSVDDSLKMSQSVEIEYKKIFTINSLSTQSIQGLAIYDDYLFNCHHSNNVIDVYDLKTYQKVASISLDPVTIIHANNVNFSSQFYDSNDKFPLLYIQHRGYANKVNVYRIIVDKENNFTAQLIQTLSFSPCDWSITTIDSDKNILYVLFGQGKGDMVSTFSCPSYADGDIIINVNKGINTYSLPMSKVTQDTAFKGKYLYFVRGTSNQGELWRVDMENKTAICIDLTKYNLKSEPEGIDVYNSELIVSFINKSVYKIKIID